MLPVMPIWVVSPCLSPQLGEFRREKVRVLSSGTWVHWLSCVQGSIPMLHSLYIDAISYSGQGGVETWSGHFQQAQSTQYKGTKILTSTSQFAPTLPMLPVRPAQLPPITSHIDTTSSLSNGVAHATQCGCSAAALVSVLLFGSQPPWPVALVIVTHNNCPQLPAVETTEHAIHTTTLLRTSSKKLPSHPLNSLSA